MCGCNAKGDGADGTWMHVAADGTSSKPMPKAEAQTLQRSKGGYITQLVR